METRLSDDATAINQMTYDVTVWERGDDRPTQLVVHVYRRGEHYGSYIADINEGELYSISFQRDVSDKVTWIEPVDADSVATIQLLRLLCGLGLGEYTY